MELRFGVQSAEHRSRPVSAQRMVNCYLEQAPAAAKSPVAVVPSYGVASFATPGNGPLRGGCVVNGTVYVVSGTTLYSVNAAGTATSLGTIPNLDDVEVAGDGTNIVVVTATAGYVWNGSSVSQITDADFPGAIWVGFLDGYFPIIEPNSGRLWINETAYTPTAWNALDFATEEGSPDDIVWALVEKREWFVFGKDSTAAYQNTGNADFPFERVPSSFMEVGIKAKRLAAKANNSVCFVGHDNIVYRLDGYTPIRISTHAVEQALEDTDETEFRMFGWVEGGHQMLGLKCADFCFVYDFSTQLWHERGTLGSDTWTAHFVLHAFGKYLIAKDGTNELGKLTADLFTEWGDTLRTECTSAAVAQENRLLPHDSLELVFETGVGTVATPDPQVMLQFSDDGGRTWSSEKWRSLGAIGEYQHRCRWHRLGSSRDRVYRYAITDPVRRTLISAILNGDA